MTTNNHLNNFVEIDSKTHDELSNIVDKLLQVKHLDIDNTHYLASSLVSLERYDESVMQYERILAMKSYDEKALLGIGIAYFNLKDYRKALEYLKRGLELDPVNEIMLSYKMLSHELLNDYASAVMTGNELLSINPTNNQVIKRLVDYHFELREFDLCIYYLRQVKYDNYKKAVILYEAGKYKECIEASRKAKTSQSYQLAAKAYQKLDNTVKAVKYLYKSYEMDGDVDTLFEISEIYFKNETYKRAIYFLKKVLLHDDLNVKAYCMIAKAYLEGGDWYDAVEYARMTLEITKKVPEAYITLSQAQFQIDGGDHNKSVEIIEEGLIENPDSAELWIEKGGYCFCDDPYTFRESFEKAISLKPDDSEIYFKYIDLLLMSDEMEMAKIYYNKLLLVNPLFDKSFEELKDPWTRYL